MGLGTLLMTGLLMFAVPDAQTIEREARRIDAMLIAPCCWSQQVSVHRSPVAEEIRRDIRERLARGETRDMILEAYVARYGVAVLAEPPARGSAWLLYVLPPLVLVASAALVVGVMRRSIRHPVAASDGREAMPRVDEERYATRLEDELSDLD